METLTQINTKRKKKKARDIGIVVEQLLSHLRAEGTLHRPYDIPLLGQWSSSRTVSPSGPGSISVDTGNQLDKFISVDRNLFLDVVRIPQ